MEQVRRKRRYFSKVHCGVLDVLPRKFAARPLLCVLWRPVPPFQGAPNKSEDRNGKNIIHVCKARPSCLQICSNTVAQRNTDEHYEKIAVPTDDSNLANHE